VECRNPHFVFVGYFTHDQICNLNRDYDLKHWRISYFFFKLNKLITHTLQWHNNKGGIGHSINLIIKAAFLQSVSYDVKLQDVEQTDEVAGHEIAGHENARRENAKHENVLAYSVYYIDM